MGQNCHVEVELVDDQGNREQMEFDLVTEKAADFDNGRIAISTPLGKAIRGKFAGNVVDYVKGDIRKIRIVKVTPLQSKAPEDATPRRQAILDEAVRKAERTDAEMFAASYNGKWGDYNTDEVDDLGDDARNR